MPKKTVPVLVVADLFYYVLPEVTGQFEAETGITVELENLAYDALQARLVSSSIARKPDADVVTVDQMETGQYLDNRWISPLDPMIKADKGVDLTDLSARCLQRARLGYFGNTGVTWNDIGAAAVAAMLPPMLIFLIMGRYVVRGLTVGSLKG